MNLRTVFLLSIAVVWVLGCRNNTTVTTVIVESLPAADQAGVETARNSSPHHFGDFSFSIPAGWTVVAPDRDKTKAMILLGGTTWQNARAMIKVDVGAPAAPTAEALAQGFAEGTGGTVSSEPMDFGGTPGIHASAQSTTLTTPRNMIVIYRDDQAYLLMAGAVEGIELTGAVDYIRDTWTWTKSPKPPAAR